MPKQSVPSVINYGDLDNLMGYKLRRAQVSFFESFAQRCSKFGITPGLFGVLSLVKHNPGQTQTAIANALGNDRSAMVSVVDRLEAMNVLERKPSVSDRRSHALFLTLEGETFYTQLIEEVKQHEQQFMQLLAGDEAKIIADVLDRFAALKTS